MNRNEIQESYVKASQEIKNVLSSQETVDKISALGKKYGLQIDELGKIEEIVTIFALGIITEKGFSESVLEIVADDSKKAESLTKDINEILFLPIRKTLIEEPPKPLQTVLDNRDSLLSAIENPAPTEHPISIGQEKPLEKTRPSSGDEVAHDFIGEKLTTPVSLPSQKTVVTPAPPSPVKQKPSVDPYRESIN
jgi:hypothetical protein